MLWPTPWNETHYLKVKARRSNFRQFKRQSLVSFETLKII